MLEEDFFNLAWPDFTSSRVNHVLFPVHDAVVAIFVYRGDITRVKPAVSQRFSGRCRIAPVANRDVLATTNNFTRCARRYVAVFIINQARFHTGDWRSNRARLADRAGTIPMRRRRGLCEAISLGISTPVAVWNRSRTWIGSGAAPETRICTGLSHSHRGSIERSLKHSFRWRIKHIRQSYWCAPSLTIKQRVRPMLGFKRLETAALTIRGIELAEKIKKQQFNLIPLTGQATTAPGIWTAVLAA